MLIVAGGAEGRGAGLGGVIGAGAFDPFGGEGGDGDAAELFGRGVFEMKLGVADGFAEEGFGVDVDDGEFLNAFELEAGGGAVIAGLFLADGGDPGVAGDFEAEGSGEGEGGEGGEEEGGERGSHGGGTRVGGMCVGSSDWCGGGFGNLVRQRH